MRECNPHLWDYQNWLPLIQGSEPADYPEMTCQTWANQFMPAVGHGTFKVLTLLAEYVNPKGQCVTVQTSGVELAEGLLMTAGLNVNSRYEPKNSRRSDTQIPSSLNSYGNAGPAWNYCGTSLECLTGPYAGHFRTCGARESLEPVSLV